MFKVIKIEQHRLIYLIQNKADSLIALGRNISVVNMESQLDYSSDMSDSLHPNSSGYQKMANVWYAALQNYLPVLRLRVFLQGPYTSGGMMSTSLQSSGLIPTTSPYHDVRNNSSIFKQ